MTARVVDSRGGFLGVLDQALGALQPRLGMQWRTRRTKARMRMIEMPGIASEAASRFPFANRPLLLALIAIV